MDKKHKTQNTQWRHWESQIEILNSRMVLGRLDSRLSSIRRIAVVIYQHEQIVTFSNLLSAGYWRRP